ncbi:RND transporter [Methylibium sp. Pch-M]|uniref:efflux RND transporter permease subunit n=1 Tax=Methylibium sp. Pch-M TaxID=2082386 RepID=UPI00101394F3|nr:MMPL family transporter [Methylibium sp. Pch-M]QAZ38730.1 RND transporter [Methylibium sp. Pch-M]
MHADSSLDPHPVIARVEDFDRRSGNLLERAFFNFRPLVLIACLLVTLLLGWQAGKLQLNASFEKMIPTTHPYVINFLEYRGKLSGLGNSVRIAVETTSGDIYDKTYLETLARINDEVFLLPGVDRAYMKSLWTPAVRWTAVTEEGLEGGTVISEDYDGSPQALQKVRSNIERSGQIGQLVANDFKSSIIYVPLLSRIEATGQALDYAEFARQVEALRAKHESATIRIHITGFAKIIGDLIDGLAEVLKYFAVAIVIAAAMVYAYSRDLRSTLLVVSVSLVAVVWQLGLLPTLGFRLDPFSMLVPFLVFAIGMSHGAQKMNGIMQDIGRGTHKLVAARYTFRRLFLAGLTALLADAVGFAVLLVIDIPVIKELALAASLGVGVLIFTNLILLPVLLSYTGVSRRAAERSLRTELADSAGGERHRVWHTLVRFTERKWALGAIAVSAGLAALGFAASLHLQIGDLDPGAPELRPESRYNRDSAFMVANYAASADILVVMVKTADKGCVSYPVVSRIDELAWALEQLPGVDSTSSAPALAKLSSVGYNEGNLKWYELVPNEAALGTLLTYAPRELLPASCDLLPLYVYLKDHKAATLSRVVETVEAFKARHDSDEARFLLAAGSAGIEAATNIVVQRAWYEMLALVYGAVVVLCFVTFRSWRAVVVAVLPLMLTSLLAEALMVMLGIGVKVATLPVIALGVGIGVDYALYILSVMLARLRAGHTLAEAYYGALLFTGKVVMLTGLTLALGVATWAFSDIKFQADMGILLAFMFLWNMLGALILLPALACFMLKPTVARSDRAADPAVPAEPHKLAA